MSVCRCQAPPPPTPAVSLRHELKPLSLFLCALLGWLPSASAQTRLKLSAITPGTERVQLVYNGDIESQTAVGSTGRWVPSNWSSSGNLVAASGTNTVSMNGDWLACGRVDNGNTAMCQRSLQLEPNTSYVLSAYMWNLGDSANHVNAVIDLNDAPQEPQMVLSSSDSEAALGYFLYRSFNTANTGSNVTLRVFYDGFTGAGAAAKYFPFGAQWDNVAITKAADFIAPEPAGSGSNLRPTVRLESPSDNVNLLVTSALPVLALAAAAADPDGTVTNVAFFANGTVLGSLSSPPFTFNWTNPPSGPCVLTVVATDNLGAATLSAPVRVSLTAPRPPIFLSAVASNSNLVVSWSTQATALFLQSTSNLVPPVVWQPASNPSVRVGDRYQVILPAATQPQFFRLGPDVWPFSLEGKLMMGYQGWFACANDGSPVNRWVHWFRSQTTVATNLTVDFWPDISELDPDELYPTSMTLPDGSPARLYSAFNQKTVVRHFKWMKDNQLDGVFLQRFSSELSSASFFALRNRVTENVRVGAETYGRVFAMMYDISGQAAATLVSTLTNDWAYLVNTLRLTNSPCYVQHRGKPVVAIWGFGFTDRPGTPQDALAVIQFFKAAGCTVMGGVPTHWRTLDGDSQTNSTWAAVYRSFDILSPWAVGRYSTLTGADNFKQTQIVPDLAETRLRGIDYMPVVFPGFSWHNLNAGTFNQIPRLGGNFYWRQVYNAKVAGCSMVYGAMFDEMDEGTAMLKLAPTSATLPVQAELVPLNIDGRNLPSDWYLRVAGAATRMLRGDIPLTNQVPLSAP